jgi:hypothetical protein
VSLNSFCMLVLVRDDILSLVSLKNLVILRIYPSVYVSVIYLSLVTATVVTLLCSVIVGFSAVFRFSM